ncbi:MAG: DUF1345 domain-containing protein [Alphaproteobacteria bacterium]|nr:DUF1345 domain-containing protein [Alphaproteobacteria bacterium]MBL6937574.1 DUF1345 domain-containing protein [Alphaproteobacteria bacterium]MBL7098912.1 DUF1345 domain-containing protein [Alphaproteobacteria bacterium]
MSAFLAAQARHHWRFYVSIVAGLIAWALPIGDDPHLHLAIGVDAFFTCHLALLLLLTAATSPTDLCDKAQFADEGAFVVFAVALAASVFSITEIFVLLHSAKTGSPPLLILAIANVPLGWAMLHMIVAYRYAHIYYEGAGHDPSPQRGGLLFPETPRPGAWDFVYYAFVVGMTAQVSDVQVLSAQMRRLTLMHGVISFFFNTVLIALAVNVVVTLAQ